VKVVACTSALVLALQGQPEPPLRYQEQIVVTPERAEQRLNETTAAVTVLTRDAIDRAPASNLAELLALTPGLHVLFPHAFGATPMVSSRGFFGGGEVEYIQLRVDGIPVGDAESGIADWRAIASGDIEQVEILRGAGSALYGDTALGGVVDVVTRGASSANRMELQGASHGSLGASLHLNREAGDLGLVLSARGTKTGGYRERAAADELAFDARATWRSWTAGIGATSRDRQEPGPLSREEIAKDRDQSNPLFRFDRDDTTRLRASVAHEGMLRKMPFAIHVYAVRRESDITRTLLILAGLGDRVFRQVSAQTAGASISGERGVALGHLRWGVEAVHDEIDRAYRQSLDEGRRGPVIVSGDGSRRKVAAYATYDAEMTSRVRIASGLRFDAIDDRFQIATRERQRQRSWSPRLGLNFRDGARSAFVQWSRAFKAPTLDQLFDPRPFPDFQGGTFTISNPQLSPQVAQNVEAGMARRTRSSTVELVTYWMNVRDEIDFDPATFRYANIGDTVHSGVELAAAFRQETRLSPFLTYSLTHVVPTAGDNEGRQLKNIPRHLARGGITATLSPDTSAQARINWIGGRFLDDAHEFALDDAVVIDVRVARRLGRHRIVLDLFNLTNERYSEVGYVLPDFTGGAVPYEFPAPGMAFRLGLEIGF